MSRIIMYLLLTIVMMTWGLNIVAIKVLVEYFPPALMQAMRIFLAGIVVLTILYVQRYLRKLKGKEYLYIILAGLLGMVGHHFFLSVGLAQTTATNGAIILALVPLTTTVLAIFFLKEKFNLLRFLGISCALIGVLLVILQGSGGMAHLKMGDLYIFISMISQALSFIVIKKIAGTVEPKLITGYMLISGSVIMLFISFIIEPQGTGQLHSIPTSIWLIFLASAIISTGLGQMLYNMAIGQLGASQTSIFINLCPFFALVGAALFLQEVLVYWNIVGFLLIVTGVILGTGHFDQKWKRLTKYQPNLTKATKNL